MNLDHKVRLVRIPALPALPLASSLTLSMSFHLSKRLCFLVFSSVRGAFSHLEVMGGIQ